MNYTSTAFLMFAWYHTFYMIVHRDLIYSRFVIAELQALCEKLNAQITQSEEDKYDYEVKLATQEAEVPSCFNCVSPCFASFTQLLATIFCL